MNRHRWIILLGAVGLVCCIALQYAFSPMAKWCLTMTAILSIIAAGLLIPWDRSDLGR